MVNNIIKMLSSLNNKSIKLVVENNEKRIKIFVNGTDGDNKYNELYLFGTIHDDAVNNCNLDKIGNVKDINLTETKTNWGPFGLFSTVVYELDITIDLDSFDNNDDRNNNEDELKLSLKLSDIIINNEYRYNDNDDRYDYYIELLVIMSNIFL